LQRLRDVVEGLDLRFYDITRRIPSVSQNLHLTVDVDVNLVKSTAPSQKFRRAIGDEILLGIAVLRATTANEAEASQPAASCGLTKIDRPSQDPP
jgi:hypothetical protein